MNLLAFDIATSTGVAFGCAGEKPKAWSVDLGKSRSDAAKFAKAQRMARVLVKKYQPDLVAIEAPVGGPKTSHTLVGLWACVTGAATDLGVHVETHNIAAIRKHFLGQHLRTKDLPGLSHAKAKEEIKRAVMNRCRMLGWSVENDDAADAASLWDYACSRHSPSHHITTLGGLFNG